MYEIVINGETRQVDVDADTPLLWVIRDSLEMTATKFGCGLSQCGSCTVLLNGVATRCCQFPVSAAVGMEITTMEGLLDNPLMQRLQQAWDDIQVSQCGYCQNGQLMLAYSTLSMTPDISDKDLENSMINICRCGTYDRILTAVTTARDDLFQEA